MLSIFLISYSLAVVQQSVLLLRLKVFLHKKRRSLQCFTGSYQESHYHSMENSLTRPIQGKRMKMPHLKW